MFTDLISFWLKVIMLRAGVSVSAVSYSKEHSYLFIHKLKAEMPHRRSNGLKIERLATMFSF